jgi:MarR family transcriptional regulator, transcriptional regulator for hemolysin
VSIAVERTGSTSCSAGLEDNLGWLLAQASHVLQTELTAAFEARGHTPRGYCVLTAARGGRYTQKELADAVGLDKTTMVVTVDALEREGLARRVPSPEDRRARVIEVTPEGEKVVAEGDELMAAIQEQVLATLTPESRDALMEGLGTLVRDRLSTPAVCSRAPRRRA